VRKIAAPIVPHPPQYMSIELATRLRAAATATRAVLITGVLAVGAAAQTTTARVTGTVTTAGHEPVAGAEVIARAISTNLTRTARAGANGSYALPGLAPGEYDITARRLGYPPRTRHVEALVGQTLTVDFILATANAPTSAQELAAVRVSAAAEAAIEQRSSEVATNITREQIENTPLPDRNFLSLALLAPGVRRDGGSITSGAQSANNLNVFVDGVSYKNDVLTGGTVGQDASKGNPFPPIRAAGATTAHRSGGSLPPTARRIRRS
jgi:hypothetical protein